MPTKKTGKRSLTQQAKDAKAVAESKKLRESRAGVRKRAAQLEHSKKMQKDIEKGTGSKEFKTGMRKALELDKRLTKAQEQHHNEKVGKEIKRRSKTGLPLKKKK